MEIFYIEDEQQNLHNLWGLLKNLSFKAIHYFHNIFFKYCVETKFSLKQAYMSWKVITDGLYLCTDSRTERQEERQTGGHGDMMTGGQEDRRTGV